MTLTITRLREVLAFHPFTGLFFWRRPNSRRVKPGQVAGYKNPYGYIEISIDGRLYKAHRVAWFYCHGEWPPRGDLDHKNGIKDANWIRNLRPATRAQNMWNSGISSRNTSGTKGVSWDASRGLWKVAIKAGGKQKALGRYKDFDEAVAVRMQAETEFYGAFRRAA